MLDRNDSSRHLFTENFWDDFQVYWEQQTYPVAEAYVLRLFENHLHNQDEEEDGAKPRFFLPDETIQKLQRLLLGFVRQTSPESLHNAHSWFSYHSLKRLQPSWNAQQHIERIFRFFKGGHQPRGQEVNLRTNFDRSLFNQIRELVNQQDGLQPQFSLLEETEELELCLVLKKREREIDSQRKESIKLVNETYPENLPDLDLILVDEFFDDYRRSGDLDRLRDHLCLVTEGASSPEWTGLWDYLLTAFRNGQIHPQISDQELKEVRINEWRHELVEDFESSWSFRDIRAKYPRRHKELEKLLSDDFFQNYRETGDDEALESHIQEVRQALSCTEPRGCCWKIMFRTFRMGLHIRRYREARIQGWRDEARKKIAGRFPNRMPALERLLSNEFFGDYLESGNIKKKMTHLYEVFQAVACDGPPNCCWKPLLRSFSEEPVIDPKKIDSYIVKFRKNRIRKWHRHLVAEVGKNYPERKRAVTEVLVAKFFRDYEETGDIEEKENHLSEVRRAVMCTECTHWGTPAGPCPCWNMFTKIVRKGSDVLLYREEKCQKWRGLIDAACKRIPEARLSDFKWIASDKLIEEYKKTGAIEDLDKRYFIVEGTALGGNNLSWDMLVEIFRAPHSKNGLAGQSIVFGGVFDPAPTSESEESESEESESGDAESEDAESEDTESEDEPEPG